MKKTLNTVIYVLIAIIVIVIAYIFIQKRNVTFTLNGNESITLKYGTIYKDYGVIAHDGLGKDISDNVSVTSKVNTKVPGIYEVIYELKYGGINKSLKRKVTVLEPTSDDYSLILNGDEEISILKDTVYNELGAYVLVNESNEKINDVEISGNVDTKVVGNYNVVYTYKYNDIILSKNRKINVFDIVYKINRANDNTEIEFNFNNINNYVSIKLPNGETKADKIIKYTVLKNGRYDFIIKIGNTDFTKTINVLSAGLLKCDGVIDMKGTTLNVTGDTGNIKEYEWVLPAGTVKGQNNYNKYQIINKASVNLIFNDTSTYQINCDIKNNLVYQFKYDEFFTKPEIKCNSYTETDRIRLDAQLKQVVTEAGYGTRAGVVEAARFLVGALEYKIRYQGPKAVNSVLGKYPYEGLNIGKTNAWGCSVSGWVQGMDCTNFVSWAFAQNGIKTHPYSSDHKAVREVINQIRVGDLLYSPCTSSECKNEVKLNHVGIIIGIDDKYIYVAESTTGKINAIVVTKWEKYNMPENGKFSRVHFFKKYNGDGNLTDMWLQ